MPKHIDGDSYVVHYYWRGAEQLSRALPLDAAEALAEEKRLDPQVENVTVRSVREMTEDCR